MQSITYYILCMWSMLIIRKINATILIKQSVFWYDQSVFLYDQSKNDTSYWEFWGSGSYSKTLRHNGFLIYRRTLHIACFTEGIFEGSCGLSQVSCWVVCKYTRTEEVRMFVQSRWWLHDYRYHYQVLPLGENNCVNS